TRALRPIGPTGYPSGATRSSNGNHHGSAGQCDKSPRRFHSRAEPEDYGSESKVGGCRGIQGDEVLVKHASTKISVFPKKPQCDKVQITSTQKEK
ncbi:hypothetical protein A2U01_0074111, partial [Trifolium medium]|nr:hypothetical protein [Trifolium medium]